MALHLKAWAVEWNLSLRGDGGGNKRDLFFRVLFLGDEEIFGRESMPQSERIPLWKLSHSDRCKSKRKERRPRIA
jgi:hypothetical protein